MGLRYLTLEAIIPNGTAITQIFDVGGQLVVGIQMPAAWDAAGITFLASHGPTGTMRNVFERDGTEFLVTAPLADEFRSILPTELMLARRLQIRSGTAGTPVNQTAARTLTVVILAE